MWSIKQPAMLQVPHAKWYHRGFNLASDTMKTEWHYLIAESIELIYNLNIQLFSFLCTERFMQFPPKLFFLDNVLHLFLANWIQDEFLHYALQILALHCKHYKTDIEYKDISHSNNGLWRSPDGQQIIRSTLKFNVWLVLP